MSNSRSVFARRVGAIAAVATSIASTLGAATWRHVYETHRAPGPVANDTAPEMFNVGPLRVIHQRRTTTDGIVAQLYFLGGARQISAQTAGIEPLILRASTTGTARYPGPAAQRALARTGSSIGIDAANDWSVIELRTIGSELDSAWSVFADCVMHPTLESGDVERVRTRMLAELLAESSDPNGILRQTARRVGYVGHPYANDPGGTDQSLRNLSLETLKGYHATQFVASRMLLVVVGNVDHATVERLVGGSLAQLPAGNYSWTLPPPVPLRPLHLTILPRKLESDYIIGVFPGPTTTDRDYGGFRVATALLGAHLNSVIREQEHLAYTADAPMFEDAATAGAVYITTSDPEHAMDLLMKQIESVANEGLPMAAIPWFVSQFSIEALFEQETDAGQAAALARGALLFGDYRAVDAPTRALKGFGEDRIQHLAAHFMPGVQLVLMGDTAHFRHFMR